MYLKKIIAPLIFIIFNSTSIAKNENNNKNLHQKKSQGEIPAGFENITNIS